MIYFDQGTEKWIPAARALLARTQATAARLGLSYLSKFEVPEDGTTIWAKADPFGGEIYITGISAPRYIYTVDATRVLNAVVDHDRLGMTNLLGYVNIVTNPPIYSNFEEDYAYHYTPLDSSTRVDVVGTAATQAGPAWLEGIGIAKLTNVRAHGGTVFGLPLLDFDDRAAFVFDDPGIHSFGPYPVIFIPTLTAVDAVDQYNSDIYISLAARFAAGAIPASVLALIRASHPPADFQDGEVIEFYIVTKVAANQGDYGAYGPATPKDPRYHKSVLVPMSTQRWVVPKTTPPGPGSFVPVLSAGRPVLPKLYDPVMGGTEQAWTASSRPVSTITLPEFQQEGTLVAVVRSTLIKDLMTNYVTPQEQAIQSALMANGVDPTMLDLVTFAGAATKPPSAYTVTVPALSIKSAPLAHHAVRLSGQVWYTRDSVSVYDGNAKIGAADVSNNHWVFDTPSLGAGDHLFSARSDDGSGHTSATQVLVITI